MKAQIVVEQLSANKIDAYWPEIVRELERIPHVWADWWTIESLRHFTMNGRMQVWATGDVKKVYNFVFTQVAVYPAQAILQIVLMFGNGLEETSDSLDAALESYARENECRLVEATGRKGWERWLKPRGWRYRASVMQRVVREESLQ